MFLLSGFVSCQLQSLGIPTTWRTKESLHVVILELSSLPTLVFLQRIVILLEGECGAGFQLCCSLWIVSPLLSSCSCALFSSSRHGPVMLLHGTQTHLSHHLLTNPANEKALFSQCYQNEKDKTWFPYSAFVPKSVGYELTTYIISKCVSASM